MSKYIRSPETLKALKELQELANDGKRFQWYFSNSDKNNDFAMEYMQGVDKGWTIDQWRTLIDKYMSEDLK